MRVNMNSSDRISKDELELYEDIRNTFSRPEPSGN